MGTTADTTEVTLGFFSSTDEVLELISTKQLRNAPPRQANSRKSATAGTLHLRRPLMTNRGGLLLPQPREGSNYHLPQPREGLMAQVRLLSQTKNWVCVLQAREPLPLAVSTSGSRVSKTSSGLVSQAPVQRPSMNSLTVYQCPNCLGNDGSENTIFSCSHQSRSIDSGFPSEKLREAARRRETAPV